MHGKGQGEKAGGCRLCPGECGADRKNGVTGTCGQDERIYVALAAGVENAYIQEGGTVSESFIPDFL